MRVYPGTWLAIAAASAFGGVGVFAKLAFAQGWDLTPMLGFRFLVAALVLLPFALQASGGWRGFHKAVALGMFGYVAMTMLYFSSFRELPAAAASFMLYLAPVFVAVYAWFLEGRFKIGWVGGLLSSTLGLAFMFGGAFTGVLSGVGILLAGGSAIVYAGLFIIGKRILGEVPPARVALGICSGACVGYLFIATLQGTIFDPRSLTAWGIVIGLGVASTAVALLLFYAALARAPSTQVAIISTLEPVATLAFAYVLLGETLHMLGLFGGFCILLGAVMVAVEPRGTPAIASDLSRNERRPSWRSWRMRKAPRTPSFPRVVLGPSYEAASEPINERNARPTPRSPRLRAGPRRTSRCRCRP